MSKHWFITGISRGLGLALAQAALARGDTVVGTVRSGAPLVEKGLGELHVLTLDVTDGVAIERVVAEAFHRAEGRLDVVVNNAGYGLLGALEDASDEEAQRLFATDVFGPFKVIRAALPGLRAQGEARILNITSIAGRAPGAASALYAAAKSFMIKFTESLALEMTNTGVTATAVCPGFTLSEFHDVNATRPRVEKMPKLMWLDAHTVASKGIDAAMAGRVVVVTGALNKLIATTMKHIPDAVARRVLLRQSKNFRHVD